MGYVEFGGWREEKWWRCCGEDFEMEESGSVEVRIEVGSGDVSLGCGVMGRKGEGWEEGVLGLDEDRGGGGLCSSTLDSTVRDVVFCMLCLLVAVC